MFARFAVLLIVALVACSKNDSNSGGTKQELTPNQKQDLVGSWRRVSLRVHGNEAAADKVTTQDYNGRDVPPRKT